MTKYVLLNDQLYYKTVDGVLLKCLNREEAKVLMGEVHEGICGAHQSAYKMKWIIRRIGYFGQQYWKIVPYIIRGARTVNVLVMSRNRLHRL